MKKILLLFYILIFISIPNFACASDASNVSIIMWHDSIDPYTDSNGKLKIKESYENYEKIKEMNTAIESQLNEKQITSFSLQDTKKLFLNELEQSGGKNILYPFEEAQLISIFQFATNNNLLHGMSISESKNLISKAMGQIIRQTNDKRKESEVRRIENNKVSAYQVLTVILGAYAVKGIYDTITSTDFSSTTSSSSTFGATDSSSTTSNTPIKIDGNYECSFMCWDAASPAVLDFSKKLSTEHKITVSGSDYSSAREKGLKIAKQACEDMGFYDTYSRWGKGIIDCKEKK